MNIRQKNNSKVEIVFTGFSTFDFLPSETAVQAG